MGISRLLRACYFLTQFSYRKFAFTNNLNTILFSGDELADIDFKEFKRLKIEGENWIRIAKLLREEVVQPTSFEFKIEEGRSSSDLRGNSAASSHEVNHNVKFEQSKH